MAIPVINVSGRAFAGHALSAKSTSLSGWQLNEKHFAKFASIRDNNTMWEGRVPRKWAYYVTGEDNARLSSRSLKYGELLTIAADGSGYDHAEVFHSIMAWGGMNIAHGRAAWRHFSTFRSLIAGLRRSEYSRREAYHTINSLVSELENPGMGPSNFTKLIYFCCPERRGYLMDQWTGKSINLLFTSTDGSGRRPVLFYDHRVSPKNTAERYEQFCQLVDSLGDLLGAVPGSNVLQRLFSSGARGAQSRGRWRQYVEQHRP